MTKEQLIALAKQVAEATKEDDSHDHDVICFGICGKEEVHMTEEGFLKMFPCYKTKEFNESYRYMLFVEEDGVRFYCLTNEEPEL